MYAYAGKILHVDLSTEKVWEEILTLPLYPDLTAAEQTKVISSIKAFFKK